MSRIIQSINGYLWGLPMIAVLLSLHIFSTLRYGFIQKNLGQGIRLSLRRQKGESGDISPFSTLATTLASTLGTGNIIGVSSAVALGGAGAVFWCWISGIFGMATQYAEGVLAVKYREKSSSGQFRGGPMYVLKNGVKSKTLGIVYALLASLCGLITGAAIQSKAVGDAIIRSYGKNVSVWVGIVTGILTALVIFGGISSISKLCTFFVPLMAGVYLIGCMTVLYINRAYLADSVIYIMKEAFSFEAALGGSVGSVILLSMRYGLSRGLFSNEAGLGTSSVVSACAQTENPVRQGLVTMTATFWDTVVMCLITGLMVVSSVLSRGESFEDFSKDASLCYKAFAQIPFVGEAVLCIGLVTFAFSTILGWEWTGESCFGYIFGEKRVSIYRFLWVAAVAFAPMLTADLVWSIGDLCNGLLIVPNGMALLMLSSEVREETHKYIGIYKKKHRT